MASVSDDAGFACVAVAFVSAGWFLVVGLVCACAIDLACTLAKAAGAPALLAALLGGVHLLAGNLLFYTHPPPCPLAGLDCFGAVPGGLYTNVDRILTRAGDSVAVTGIVVRAYRLDRVGMVPWTFCNWA